ncbi:MAG TPA: glycogen debranching protein GlgX [Kiritimatiellia bacterium]|nr:glycogen debranching protein GlgX [Kiritimatiellia bacterium]
MKNQEPNTKHLLPSTPVPVPYGAQVLDKGVQFTIFSRHAKRVWLMLFDNPDDAEPSQEYELTPEENRIGDIWHLHVEDAREGQFYAYRMGGSTPRGVANFFDPDQWLLDPYALAVCGWEKWGDIQGLEPGKAPKRGPLFPKGVIVRDDFDWTQDRTPRTPLSESVIYETHLRGFTVHPSSGVRHAGTYRGLIEKIPYLKDLGVTAVELLPIQEFNELEYFLENGPRRNLRNYWGYSTLAFFAPNGRYAQRGVHGQQLREFKEMVVALHQAGIELILDVVFNHTTEGGDGGPTYSFRGIDNSIYYMMEEARPHYKNFSGCGNTVNSNHVVVRNFIMDCLRYWVLHMHVDGFRFDLASVLTRGPDGGLLPNPPIVEQIAEDPALRDTKIIAEAWDAAGTYQVGSFPNERWSEWNGLYRDEMRRFWKGEEGMLGRMATRLTGSSDLYDKDGQAPLKSINFLTCHDGFTLCDLVSYNDKHNEDNAEANRDGENHNHSSNFGEEGPTTDPEIRAMRRRQQKNFIATLFLSQGVPMFPAGDEFSRTQRGNNNAYCQDNETSWVDWSLLKENGELHEFTKRMIAFRKAHPCLRRTKFFVGKQPDETTADIVWIGKNGEPPDWDKDLTLACLINGHHEYTGATEDDESLFIILNADEKPATFTVPVAPDKPWVLALTTEEQDPMWYRKKGTITVDGKSVTVLASAPFRRFWR